MVTVCTVLPAPDVHGWAMLGVTAGEFRSRFSSDVTLERYVDLLIAPDRETLRAFCPLNAGAWDQGAQRCRCLPRSAFDCRSI